MMEIKNAIIKSAVIDTGDRGLLTAWLHLDYGGSGQGFGGYALYLPKSYKHHGANGNYAGHFIFRAMEVAEVISWDKLIGKTVRVKADHGKVHAIGHIVKDDWFNPTEDFEEMERASESKKTDTSD